MRERNKNLAVRFWGNNEKIEESFSKAWKFYDICTNVGHTVKTNSTSPVYLPSEVERGSRIMKAKAGQIALIIISVIGIVLMGIDLRLLACSSFPVWISYIFILSMMVSLFALIFIFKYLR